MTRLFARIAQALFPDTCPLCGRVIAPGLLLCGGCEKYLLPYRPERPEVVGDATGRRAVSYTAAFWYAGGPRRALTGFKYHHQKQYATLLAPFVANRVETAFGGVAFEAICLVPSREDKAYGYRHLEVLAEHLSKALHLPVLNGALYYTRKIPPQHTLHHARRAENVKGAFAAQKQLSLEGKSLLLIDDVITTGSTIEACAQALYDAGARVVCAAAVARTPRGKDRAGQYRQIKGGNSVG